jgi:lipopolysaccharide/colanic/teichoic acid biosynthesis glycosyltransferase
MLKRACDLVVAALGLLLTGPLIAAIALALTIGGRGPVFYRSPRLGQGGRVFHLVRFRTMVVARAPAGLSPDASPQARLTPVGRFIRNHSLDDLPSLVHVLRGDLSLVGPRPMEVDRVDPAAPTWRRILSVRPGYVSYAILQLGAHYNASCPTEKERLELEYVARQSFLFDLSVLAATLWGLLRSGGNIKARGKPVT